MNTDASDRWWLALTVEQHLCLSVCLFVRAHVHNSQGDSLDDHGMEGRDARHHDAV